MSMKQRENDLAVWSDNGELIGDRPRAVQHFSRRRKTPVRTMPEAAFDERIQCRFIETVRG